MGEGYKNEVLMQKISTCCSCGYSWPTGTNGDHSCASVLQETVRELRKGIKAALTDVVQSLVKEDDGSICSSLTHLNMAAAGLLSMVDAFNADGAEARALLFAIGEYGSCKQKVN